MEKSMLLLYFIVIFLSCKNGDGQSEGILQIKTFSYSETTIPNLFEQLVTNHYRDFAAIDHSDFEDFCSQNKLPENDSIIEKRFYTIKILHQLFTSKSASNGSKGDILNIPYYWHWTDPNPRYEITSLATKQKLNTLQPPHEFAKYKSYADIDRTPYMFLSELLHEKTLYSSSAGEFSTFGWCSEREMAFVCLMELLGFNGQVITNGNHSWSEFIITFSKNGKSELYKLKVDNTFDRLEWQSITPSEKEIWSHQTFPGQGDWYNKKAHSETEAKRISSYIVSVEAMKNVEGKVVAYLKAN